jgi:ubiquinone/menaquinone biosynthesis C-methylase UbiE
MQSSFDITAPGFERWRGLPFEAVQAIPAAIRGAVAVPSPARVLDLGAGTGRIGKAFVIAGDFYTGVDTSFAMLHQFPVAGDRCHLLQADGSQLPFRDGVFDLVLLMQVLSTTDWQKILCEVRRVLRPGGAVAVGHTVRPEEGIDARLKRQLAATLEEMQIAWHEPKKSRKQALALLKNSAARHVHLQAATWSVHTSAEEFLERRRTGARFAALPADVQEQALTRLRAWAEASFGSVKAEFQEARSFELDIFQF